MEADARIAATRQSLAALHVQRQSLELEAEAIASELTTPPGPGIPPMGIDDPLVDAEGYPRNDIDLYRAKSLRGRLAELRTDRHKITQQIEQYLYQLARLQNPTKAELERHEYAARLAPKPLPKYDPVSGKWVVRNWDGTISGSGRPDHDARSFDQVGGGPQPSEASTASSGVAAAATTTTTPDVPDYSRLRPFARVNSVAEHSPAEAAGLRPNDLIVHFGAISLEAAQVEGGNNEDNDPLQAVAQIVPQVAAQRESLVVVVRRSTAPRSDPEASTTPQTTHLELALAPQPWAGRGLLGCHILPYNDHGA